MMDVNTISTIARGVAQQVTEENAPIGDLVVSTPTTDATPTEILSITPADQSAGVLWIWFAGFDATNAITGIKAVRYKKVAGTVTLGTVGNLLATEIDGGLTASLSITASTGNLLVQVTGVAATDMEWVAEYKFLNVIKEGVLS
jgi:hypothetical protein